MAMSQVAARILRVRDLLCMAIAFSGYTMA